MNRENSLIQLNMNDELFYTEEVHRLLHGNPGIMV